MKKKIESSSKIHPTGGISWIRLVLADTTGFVIVPPTFIGRVDPAEFDGPASISVPLLGFKPKQKQKTLKQEIKLLNEAIIF